MVELLRLYLKILLRCFTESRWLQWLLGVSAMAVVAGLIPVVRQGTDPLWPFGISGLDLLYLVALSVLLLAFVFVFVSMIGVPLLRYGGVWLMLLGIGIVGYQAYGFVRFDAWQPFALRDFTDVLFLTIGLDEATGWAKRILRAFLAETPLSLGLIACGALWHAGARKILDHELQDLRDAESRQLKPMADAHARPNLAPSPARWVPVRLYRRTPVELRKPIRMPPFVGKGESARPPGTRLRHS